MIVSVKMISIADCNRLSFPPPSPSSDKAACTALYNYVIAYYSIESSQLSQVSSEEVP